MDVPVFGLVTQQFIHVISLPDFCSCAYRASGAKECSEV